MKFIDFFSGIGGIRLGLELAGHQCLGFCEWDKYARQSYKAMFDTEGGWENHDIRTANSIEIPRADLWCFGFPCFTGDTLIKTDKGLVEIKDLCVGDMVLTHLNRFKPIVQTMNREVEKTYHIHSMGSDEIVTTPNHPFWVRKRKHIWNNEKRAYDRLFENPSWVKAEDLTKDDFLSIPVNDKETDLDANNLPLQDERFYWLIGRWLGDGWTTISKTKSGKNRYRVTICCGKHKFEDMKNKLGDLFPYSLYEQRTTINFVFCNKDLVDFLRKYGTSASTKFIHQEILDLPVEKLKLVLDGYMSADGCVVNGYCKANSVSKKLIYGLAACVNKVYKTACSVYKTKRPPTCVIEGRTVNQKDTYSIQYKLCPAKQDNSFYENGFIYVPINKIDVIDEHVTVYNIGVKDDESYTANSVSVHNCQDISIAGKQKGLENGERSGLFFQVMRLLAGTQEEDKPEWLLAENVRNLLSIGNGFDFLRLLIEMGRVGYDVQWQLLDSKDYGVAQHRERVFIIGHLRSKGRREVFPISPADGKNLTELHQVGRLKDANRENSSRYRVYDPDGLAPALTTMGGGGLEPCIVENVIKQIGHVEGYGLENHQAYRVYDANGIAPTLIKASDGKVPHIVDGEVKQIGHGTSKDGKPIQGYGVFDPSGLAPTLTTGHGSAQPYVATNADIKVVGNYTPSGFHGSKVVDPTGIAPTVMENHGMGTAVVVNEVKCIGNKNPSGHGNGGAVYDSDGIAPTICCGDKSYTYVTCKAILTPDREEKRQNGRRMKEDGEPMFTLTTQDRHGVVIGSCYTHGKESSSNRPLMQNTSRAVLAEQRVGVAILKKERTEYGKEIRKAYEAGEIQEQRKNMTQFTPRTDGISNTITTVTKDNYLMVEENETDTDNNAL